MTGLLDRCRIGPHRTLGSLVPVCEIDCAGGVIEYCIREEAIAASIDGETWHTPRSNAPIRSIWMAEFEGRAIIARLIAQRAKREIERQRRDVRLGGLSAVDRARRYLAKMDASIVGQGGSLALLKAASALVGFDMSDDEALALLGEYNERSAPPWSERDLRFKWKQACREQRIPRGSLLDARRAA